MVGKETFSAKGLGTILLLLIAFVLSFFQALGLRAEAASNFLEKLRPSIVFVTSRALTENDLYALTPHKGTGPGFIIDGRGHIVCASSIISDVHAIEVTLADRSFWPARLIGKDPETGMALLLLKAPESVMKSLVPLSIPKRWRLALGETVWALGVTPTGEPLAARGIAAVPKRDIIAGEKRWYGLIQTSIPIDGSLNGAPLFDSVGKLVGMNLELPLDFSHSGNAGFAVAIDRINSSVQRLLNGGSTKRAWFGASFIPIDATLSRLLNLPQEKGILLVKVEPGGPAAKAGLMGSTKRLRIGNKIYPIGGDFVVALDRRPIEDEEDLKKILDSAEPGSTMLVSFYRDGRLKRLPLRLEPKK